MLFVPSRRRPIGGCQAGDSTVSRQSRQTPGRPSRPRRTAASARRKQRTEAEIVKELEESSKEMVTLEDARLRHHIRLGECLLEAGDPSRKAGGIEKWSAKRETKP